MLFEYLDFPALNVPKVDFHSGNTSYEYEDADEIEQLEEIATKVRERWGLGMSPIKDLRYVLESNGIIITCFDTNTEKIDAFSQRTIIDNGDIFFIVISKTGQTVARARFDMAHELAHILLHPWSEDLELISKEEFKARERQANRLASALLLPRVSFAQDVSLYPTNLEYYKHLKEKWNVSIQAMIYRAHQLEIITTNQYQYLMRQVSKNGWRNGEPGDIPYQLKDNLLQSAVDMLISNRILTGDEMVAKLKEKGLAMHPNEIENLLCLKSGTLNNGEKKRPNIIQLKAIDK
jgi:Zn-dependent peptidase ImmA (M78 family)